MGKEGKTKEVVEDRQLKQSYVFVKRKAVKINFDKVVCVTKLCVKDGVCVCVRKLCVKDGV